MFGFLIKKSFYNLWDNLLKLGLLNLAFALSVAAILLIPPAAGYAAPATVAALAAAGLWACVFLAAATRLVGPVSDHGSLVIGAAPAALKASYKRGLSMAILAALWLAVATLALPFYAGMGTLLGTFAGAAVFWVLVLSALALQFYASASARLHGNPIKIAKKCFLIFFDNPLFAIGTALYGLLLAALSLFLVFLFPGPVGLALYADEALRLRLLKYDYLEAHPEADRRRIPWEEILAEERELVGNRSLKSLIFPWKE